MKIVAVTSCPVGMAHTYMARTALKEAAQKKGLEIRVETQGIVGIQDRLPEVAIKAADAVILTEDVVIEEEERFEGMLIYRTTTSEIIKHSDKIVEEVINLIQKGENHES